MLISWLFAVRDTCDDCSGLIMLMWYGISVGYAVLSSIIRDLKLMAGPNVFLI